MTLITIVPNYLHTNVLKFIVWLQKKVHTLKQEWHFLTDTHANTHTFAQTIKAKIYKTHTKALQWGNNVHCCFSNTTASTFPTNLLLLLFFYCTDWLTPYNTLHMPWGGGAIAKFRWAAAPGGCCCCGMFFVAMLLWSVINLLLFCCIGAVRFLQVFIPLDWTHSCVGGSLFGLFLHPPCVPQAMARAGLMSCCELTTNFSHWIWPADGHFVFFM